MRLIVETDEKQEKALIVEKNSGKLSSELANHINEYDIHVSSTTELPYSFKDIDYMFIIGNSFTEGELKQIFTSTIKTILITSEKKVYEELKDLIEKNVLDNVKAIRASLNETDNDIVERIIWFMLSSSSEISLDIHPVLDPQKKMKKKTPFSEKMTRKRIVTAALFVFLMLHTLFIIPLLGGGYYIYSAGTQLKDQKFAEAKDSIQTAEFYYNFAQATYSLAQPGLRFLFLSVLPENILSIEENAITFISTTIDASDNTRNIARLLLDTRKNNTEIQDARERIQNLEDQVIILKESSQNVYDRLSFKNSKIQDIRKDFERISGYLDTGSQLIGHLDTILGDNAKKDYVFFFYNNMEIRPGGGFIGSFAIVSFQDYTLQSFDVYDVYDADGQLKTHVRPPAPIRDYLNQPHWFLRDSNFSPDFEQNVETAEYFLDRELNLTDFDGAAAFTTTALTYILEAFGDVHIPQFNQTINADNFYLTAQGQSELDFFPGSNQKKSFLSTVGRTLLLKLEDANPALLGIGIKKALDEKHIVLLNNDPAVQSDIDVLGWSGKLVNPQCIVNNSNCLVNHIMPVDANFGVNKANYFVSRLMKLRTSFEKDGTVHNELSLSYTNASSEGVFPGGTYKNYFQVYVPHDADIESIEIAGEKIDSYDVSKTGFFKIVGVYLIIPAESTRVVTVSYSLKEKMKSGQNAYQIVFQKQIGSLNNDFSLEIDFPEDVLITEQNFKSVAKNNSVLYNSSLTTNKIFVIEFVKE